MKGPLATAGHVTEEGSTMTTSTTEKKHSYKPAFKADEQLAANLQKVAVDLINLHIVGKQAHWNVVGKNFRDLHLQLDELVEAAREFSDDISERMRSIYVTPDGRASTIAKTTSIAEFPEGEVDTAETVDLIVAAIYATAGTIREVHDDVDEADPTTADLLHGFLERLEQLAWMIEAENRVANKTAPAPIHE
jgi:starvation-inducible DNA-binding protein